MKIVILVVDDEKPILNLFARVVNPRYEVILVDNGDDAITRLLSDEEIDVTFLDLMLGHGPSGLEVLKTVRSEAPARLERIVIATGAEGIPGIEEALDNFREPTTGNPLKMLRKPYNVGEIEKMVRMFTAKQAPRGPKFPPPRSYTVHDGAVREGRGEIRRQPSVPDREREISTRKLPSIADDPEEEKSVITRLAESDNPVAKAIVELRESRVSVDTHDALRKDVDEMKAHFKDAGPKGKDNGMVTDMKYQMHSVASTLNFMKVIIPIIAIVLGGLWTLMKLNEPKASDIAREIQKTSQQVPK